MDHKIITFLVIGICVTIAGGGLWLQQEKNRLLISGMVVFSICLILTGGALILKALTSFIQSPKSKQLFKHFLEATVLHPRWYHYLFIFGLIYIGSVSYTIAAYYHLKIKEWSFPIAFAIALPLILIEYQFSIRGNRAAHSILKLNAVQITLLTLAFYFVNSWILNKLVLKQDIIIWREVLAFVLILCAFVLILQKS